MQARAFCTVHDWTRCNQPDVRGAATLSSPRAPLVVARAELTAAPAVIVKRFVEVPFEAVSLGQPQMRWFRRFHRADEYFQQRCRSNRWATMYRVRGRYEVVTRR
jgi:hypothetical protein